MGTFVEVKVASPEWSRARLAKAADGAIDYARELEKKFSGFDPESEVNALNLAKTLVVSPELFELVEKAKLVSAATGGEFDVTVAPILKLDGFYGSMPKRLLNAIPDTFGGVDWNNIILKPEDSRVILINNAWMDLSGIAKGYIVDKMAGYLVERGVQDIMINAGGDIYCGSKNKELPWKVGIRNPGSNGVVLALSLKDMAVATSGDYENILFDRGAGEEITHIINPATDEALKMAYSSVTVIASTCTIADALATGMMAMGRADAIVLADSLKGVFIVSVECSGGRDNIAYSSGAERFVSPPVVRTVS